MINGKVYIGQSSNPHRRFTAHLSRAKAGDKSALYCAIRKYGSENFAMEILEWTDDYNSREKELIIKHKSSVPNGYNIANGGEDPPHRYGEEHHNSVITERQIDVVISELKRGVLTEPEIGRMFNPPINQVLINNINWGITHKRENESYPIRTQCPYNLTQKEVDEIKWLLANSSFPCYQISEYYGVNTSTIKHINSGRNYYDNTISYPIRKTKGSKQSIPVEAILAKRSTNAIDTHLEMGVCT